MKWNTRCLVERTHGPCRVPHASPNMFVHVPVRGNRSLRHIAVLYARKYIMREWSTRKSMSLGLDRTLAEIKGK